MLTHPLVPVRGRHRAVIILALLALVVGLAFATRSADLEAHRLQVAPAIAYHPVLASLETSSDLGEELALDDHRPPRAFTLERGQTMAHLLRDLGVEETRAALEALGEHLDLRRVRAGTAGLATYDPEGRFDSLRMELGGRGWIHLANGGEGFRAELREFVRAVRVRRIEGELETALFTDIQRAGGAPQVAYRMADVLQWDLDFNRDLRLGDRFRVLYEEITLDGRFADVGRVLALEYENRGAIREAYLWDDGEAEGYYDAHGQPLQKMFLRSPLPFTRVTSRFSHSRFHPVLKRYRPHYGVDFGAPRGTPVRVTANGTVTFAGRSGGAGNMVKVRHPNGYETAYLHLSGFAQGVRRGVRVRQGDLVGYVGSTGLSTGPHLDYRVKKGGRYMDPLTLENKPAPPIPQQRLASYLDRRDLLRQGLGSEAMPETILALSILDAEAGTDESSLAAAGKSRETTTPPREAASRATITTR